MSNIKKILNDIGAATLVAATKYVNADRMIELLESGITNFGENRANDFLKKYQELENYQNITWHFIGHLQTNKVKSIINKISFLHSLNSYKLATIINKYRIKPLNCFIEINLTNNANKSGICKEEVIPLLESLKNLKNINVIGLMTMSDSEQTDKEKLLVFTELTKIRNDLNKLGYNNIVELSMGMSDDYHLALKSGATLVRLGRILFE